MSLIVGGFKLSLIETSIGWIEGAVSVVCLVVLGILLFKVVAPQNPSTVIRDLQAESLSREDTPEILASVCRFSEMAGIPTVKAYQTTADQVTTLSAGWSPASSIIILNLRALEALTAEERDSMIAIEIAHIKFRDHLLRTIIMSTAGLGYLLLADMVLQIAEVYLNVRRDISKGLNAHILSDRRLFYLIGGPAALSIAPIVLVLGVSIRAIIAEQEYRADAWSAHVVGSALSPASAISKLAATVASPNRCSRDYSVSSVGEPRPRKWSTRHLCVLLYPSRMNRVRKLSKYMSVKN